MTEREELTVARLRAGLSISVAGKASGVDEGRLERFENLFYPLSPEETGTLREFYGDFLAAIDEAAQFPNIFDAGAVQYFIGRFRQRREQRERQQKFLDDNCINAFGRPDAQKLAVHHAEAAQEVIRRTAEKAQTALSDAKFAIDELAGPKTKK